MFSPSFNQALLKKKLTPVPFSLFSVDNISPPTSSFPQPTEESLVLISLKHARPMPPPTRPTPFPALSLTQRPKSVILFELSTS